MGGDCKGTFGCHSFGLNMRLRLPLFSCASAGLPVDFRQLPLSVVLLLKFLRFRN
jgi:hypothetical protein